MDVVEQFLTQYLKEFDFYDQAARLGAQLIEQQLQSAGIRAIVTARAKSPTRLADKLRKRSKTKTYATIDDIVTDIVDLAGIRIALYFPAERDQVGKVIAQLFATESMQIKNFPDTSDTPAPNTNPPEKRFAGYAATHYRARLKESLLNDTQKSYGLAQIEIQVASVLMHAWAEVEHDLVYKPFQGVLSPAEYALLDQINGLVLAGEIALEQLQIAGKQRISSQGREFGSHYDLADHLLDRAGDLLKTADPDALLGRVNVLYQLLKSLDLATPDKLAPYLAASSGDFERRPLADQIIDQLLAEDPERFKAYAEATGGLDLGHRVAISLYPAGDGSDQERAIGQFLARWIDLERITRQLTPPSYRTRPWLVPTTRLIAEYAGLSESEIAEFDRIRRFRNNLVHGVEVPQAAEINAVTKILEALVEKLNSRIRP